MSEENKTTEEEVVEVVAPETAPEAKETVEAPAEETPTETTPEATEEVVEEAVESEVKGLPHRDLKPGMVVKVHEIIKDVNAKGEERERTQIFEGIILGFGGSEISRTMTVRKVSNGFGVEKIYPLSSPHVSKVEIVKVQQVRRSKLWFLRRGFKRKLREIQS